MGSSLGHLFYEMTHFFQTQWAICLNGLDFWAEAFPNIKSIISEFLVLSKVIKLIIHVVHVHRLAIVNRQQT